MKNYSKTITSSISYKALIIPYTNDNKILIQDRSNIKKYYAMKWGYFGGGIEKDETPLQAVIREVYEELRLKVLNNELTFIGMFTDQPKPDKKIIRHVFLYNLKKPLTEFTLLEGKSMKLFPSNEVKKLMLLEADQKIAEKVYSLLKK